MNRNEILDLDFLVHVAYNKESRSVEVITGSEGQSTEGTPRENPVPSDEDDVPSNPVPPDQQDIHQGVYDQTTEESTEDDEDILVQRSQEKLAKVKG